MKKTSLLLGKLFLGAAVLSLSLVSCKQEPKQEDPKEMAEDSNEEKFEDMPNDSLEDDSSYLVAAAEINRAEIELSKLAQKKSMNADVKSVAKMMETAHTKAESDVKALAGKKNITIPVALTEDKQEEYNKLNEKTGNDFDKAFADDLVDGHEKAVSKIEKAAEKAKDPDIKMWAANMLPALKEHLASAKALKEKTDALK